APSTVRLTLKRLATAGLNWPLPVEMTDSVLEAALFAAVGTKQGHRRHVEPDWAEIRRAQAQARHPGDAVGRVHRAPSRRVSLFAVLRAVPQLGVATVGDDAASPCRRRQDGPRKSAPHGPGR